MIDLITEASELQKFIEDKGWEFYFVGGVALQVWGEPRLTMDIDLTIFTNLTNESAYIRDFLGKYSAKFADAEAFALTNRVLPMVSKGGIGIDLMLGGLSEGNSALERASYQKFTDEISLRLCSADDLIIMKTVAMRPKDWADIETVIIKQNNLDWAYIVGTIESLNEYEDVSGRLSKLRLLKAQYYQK